MQDDNFSDDDIRRMQEELLQSDARLKEVGGPSTLQADQVMQQVTDRAAGKHVFSKTTDDRSVFITNLPKGDNGGYNTTHEDLSNFFSDCGQILTLTILTDRKTGQPKGSAYIEFATFEGLGRALDMKQNAMFNGNTLKVEKKRSLYRPPTAAPGGRGRGGAPGMGAGMGGADPMAAMLSMMMAAAGKMMQGGMMGGGMGGGRGRGGNYNNNGGGRGRGNGGGFGNRGGGNFNNNSNANAFGNNGSVFGSGSNQGAFGGGNSNTGGGFGDGQPFA